MGQSQVLETSSELTTWYHPLIKEKYNKDLVRIGHKSKVQMGHDVAQQHYLTYRIVIRKLAFE